MTSNQGGYLARPNPSGLADVIEIVLDKGIIVDAYARVSLVGIELMTFDARIVIASVDTYLRFAEATNRLDLSDKGGRPLADLAAEGAGAAVEKVAGGVVERKVDHAMDKVGEPVEKVARAAGRKVLDKAQDALQESD
jgi:hypothetical protein